MAKTLDKHTQGGAPVGYEELRDFFPTPSERARALGVKRDTIQVWDHHRAARLRATSQGRVTLLLGLCSAVSSYMLSSRDVGRWMLSPQPSLRGRSPVDLLRDLGDEAYEQIRQLVEHDEQLLSPHNPLSGEEWDAIESELDPAVARRIRAAYERVIRGAVPDDVDVCELV